MFLGDIIYSRRIEAMNTSNITNYKPKEFAELLNVTVKTLQRWDREKILIANRTPTNRRYYTYDQYLQFKGIVKDADTRKVGYLKGMRRLLKAFKTELAPTEAQRQKIIRSIGIARFLYNQYIAYNRKLYKMHMRGLLDSRQKHFVTAFDFDKYVNHKLKIEMPWIGECGAKARKKALVNAEQAFRRFFDGRSGFPHLKKKANQDVKLYFPRNNKGDWKIWRHKLMIPTLKQVRLKECGYLPV